MELEVGAAALKTIDFKIACPRLRVYEDGIFVALYALGSGPSGWLRLNRDDRPGVLHGVRSAGLNVLERAAAHVLGSAR